MMTPSLSAAHRNTRKSSRLMLSSDAGDLLPDADALSPTGDGGFDPFDVDGSGSSGAELPTPLPCVERTRALFPGGRRAERTWRWAAVFGSWVVS